MDVMAQGLVLMVAGMGIVYVFLTVLICVAKVASRIVSKFDYLLPEEAPKKAAKAKVSSNDDADIALAITVALG